MSRKEQRQTARVMIGAALLVAAIAVICQNVNASKVEPRTVDELLTKLCKNGTISQSDCKFIREQKA